MDYGKFKYELRKKEKENKKKQHKMKVKEVKMRPVTEEHDYSFKLKHAERFLGNHDKVKFTIRFRGRELEHKDKGFELLHRIAKDLEEHGKIEQKPKNEGYYLTMVMAPYSSKDNKK